MGHRGSASQKSQNCAAKVGLSQPSDADTTELCLCQLLLPVKLGGLDVKPAASFIVLCSQLSMCAAVIQRVSRGLMGGQGLRTETEIYLSTYLVPACHTPGPLEGSAPHTPAQPAMSPW